MKNQPPPARHPTARSSPSCTSFSAHGWDRFGLLGVLFFPDAAAAPLAAVGVVLGKRSERSGAQTTPCCSHSTESPGRPRLAAHREQVRGVRPQKTLCPRERLFPQTYIWTWVVQPSGFFFACKPLVTGGCGEISTIKPALPLPQPSDAYAPARLLPLRRPR